MGDASGDQAVPEPLPGHVADLVKEYKALATAWLRKRGAWQVVDRVQAIDALNSPTPGTVENYTYTVDGYLETSTITPAVSR